MFLHTYLCTVRCPVDGSRKNWQSEFNEGLSEGGSCRGSRKGGGGGEE
jgi:hypothetical protein